MSYSLIIINSMINIKNNGKLVQILKDKVNILITNNNYYNIAFFFNVIILYYLNKSLIDGNRYRYCHYLW